jgi:hypothetical protein
MRQGYLRAKPEGKPVWPGTWSNDASARMIRKDLKEAREKWLSTAADARQRAEMEKRDFLAYLNAEGPFADFHGLRHTFITMIGKAGVSAREHMDLARHSDYRMTARYSHSRFYDLAAAVQALPLPTTGPATEPLAATGTDGRPIGDESGPKCLGPFLDQDTASEGDLLRLAETGAGMSGQQKNPEKRVVFAVFQGSGQNTPSVGATGRR